MPITVTPIAGLSDAINDIRIRTARIVNEKILPNEKVMWAGRRDEASEAEGSGRVRMGFFSGGGNKVDWRGEE